MSRNLAIHTPANHSSAVPRAAQSCFPLLAAVFVVLVSGDRL